MKRTLYSLVTAGLLALCAGAAQAQDSGRPLLLVASPALQGPYRQTALVAVPFGDKHLGFILNRASEVKLAMLFPEHAACAKVADPIYFGGPEMTEAIFAVVRRNPGPNSLRLFGELFVAGDAEVVDRIIEQTPNEARYFAGFVGWQPGSRQEIEMASGTCRSRPRALLPPGHGRNAGAVERLGNVTRRGPRASSRQAFAKYFFHDVEQCQLRRKLLRAGVPRLARGKRLDR
jgi:putative AlgH/UPF0301 family transcriptional regulator